MTTIADTTRYFDAILTLTAKHRRQTFELLLDQLSEAAAAARELSPEHEVYWQVAIEELVGAYRQGALERACPTLDT